MDDLSRILKHQQFSPDEAPYQVLEFQRDKSILKLKFYFILFVIATLAVIFCFIGECGGHKAYAETIYDNQAVRAIIGEASNQGYKGMVAVACAIRNRGSLKGIYGLKAKHVDHEPKWVWNLARKAWRESGKNDVTCGATHWENVKAFGMPRWAQKMKVAYRCGDHVFFVAKNRGVR